MSKRKWTYEEIDNYRKEHPSAFFYFNKQDSNLLIPKRYGIGRTFNWANPFAWALLLLIIGVIVWKLVNRLRE